MSIVRDWNDEHGQALKGIAEAERVVWAAMDDLAKVRQECREYTRVRVEQAQEVVREAKRRLAVKRQERALRIRD